MIKYVDGENKYNQKFLNLKRRKKGGGYVKFGEYLVYLWKIYIL